MGQVLVGKIHPQLDWESPVQRSEQLPAMLNLTHYVKFAHRKYFKSAPLLRLHLHKSVSLARQCHLQKQKILLLLDMLSPLLYVHRGSSFSCSHGGHLDQIILPSGELVCVCQDVSSGLYLLDAYWQHLHLPTLTNAPWLEEGRQNHFGLRIVMSSDT